MAPPGVASLPASDRLGQNRASRLVAQYQLPRPRLSLRCRAKSPSFPPKPTPYCTGLAATVDSAALIDAEPGLCSLVFDAELGLCRLDEEFSAFYGHRIYLCKRLENVVPA